MSSYACILKITTEKKKFAWQNATKIQSLLNFWYDTASMNSQENNQKLRWTDGR